MTPLELALNALSARKSALTSLLESLVLVNSYSGNASGVNAVGNLLIEALGSLPLLLTVDTGETGVRHLSFATARAESEPSLLLIGHHDTVFPPGEFEGYTVHGDLAKGPGVLDMKGALALVVQVLHALHEAELLESLPLRFVSVGDEEIGSPGSRALLEELSSQARAALVFEAGRAGDAVITSRRGSGYAKVRARGRAAHAGNALAEGRSAIWALSKFVDQVTTANGSIAGSSVNVGLIRGGTARNTVSEQAEAELDLRFSDSDGQAAVTALLHEAARAAERTIEGTQLEVEVTITRKPWARSEASSALAARYGKAQESAGLSYSEAKLIGGGSDANTVGALGVPAIDGLGPRGSGFHTKSEQIELSSLLPKAEALLRFLLAELGPESAR
ncbi:MAG: Peptidase [Myxococcaceae bacterium]|nr:Peptidase [Myxococcaceae bacterium]